MWAGVCGGPHLAVGIRESDYLKLVIETYSFFILTCGPPVGEAPARTALILRADGSGRCLNVEYKDEFILLDSQ